MSFPIILVSPARPENVGAAARAMKTMGFSELRIVNSQVWQDPAAYHVAHGATEILDNVLEYPDLASALADVDFSVATTARSRAKYRYYATPQQAESLLKEKQQWLGRLALIFGCEESGLSNDDLELADLLTGIPMAVEYPSLNLGQAVMVLCYQFSSLMQRSVVPQPEADPQQLQALRQRLHRLLERLQVSDDNKMSDWLDQRLGLLEQRDSAMLHRLVHDIEKKLPE